MGERGRGRALARAPRRDAGGGRGGRCGGAGLCLSRARGHTEAIRWTSEVELELWRAHRVETLGPGEWVDAWVQPYLYLADGPQRDQVREAAMAFLRTRPGIERVVDTSEGEALRASD